MRQLFLDQETTQSPRYDSETVREVLARASEIETQAEPDLLTASQVEALGSELGLSPEAVRRALGEKIGVGRETMTASRTIRRKALVPLTQEQVKEAYLINLWIALACFPIMFVAARFMHSGTMPQEIGIVTYIGIGLVIPFYLALRSGFLTKRVGVAMVGGILTTLLTTFISLIALLTAPNSNGNGIGQMILLMLFLGMVAGAMGAGARHWWDSLPRNSDR